MNLFRNTILIISLLLPFLLYAQSEMISEEMVIAETSPEMNVRIIREKPEVDIVKVENSITDEIKKVFGSNWKLAYAVMMSESGGRSIAQNVNTSGSVDNGYWQINDYYHANITLECAQDVKCSTAYAYKLSKGGTDWTPWYGYVHGGYRKFL